MYEHESAYLLNTEDRADALHTFISAGGTAQKLAFRNSFDYRGGTSIQRTMFTKFFAKVVENQLKTAKTDTIATLLGTIGKTTARRGTPNIVQKDTEEKRAAY